MKDKNIKEYIELEVFDYDVFWLSLFLYLFILMIGFFIFIVNFIRYNIKLLFYLIVCFIPFLNTSILNTSMIIKEDNNSINYFKYFDDYKFRLLENLKTTKKYEVKELEKLEEAKNKILEAK